MQIYRISLTGDDVDRIRKLLKIYSIVLFNEEITLRESQVLSEYVTYGISAETNQIISLNHGIAENNIRQVVMRLKTKGLLVNKPHKQGTELHPDLKFVRDKFVERKDGTLVLKVW